MAQMRFKNGCWLPVNVGRSGERMRPDGWAAGWVVGLAASGQAAGAAVAYPGTK
ncbi:MAG: hypothetical protein K9J46_09465 [Saprospiraceae bacterium]|nr:hypothetical protein [Saprospiraceae bacterium]